MSSTSLDPLSAMWPCNLKVNLEKRQLNNCAHIKSRLLWSPVNAWIAFGVVSLWDMFSPLAKKCGTKRTFHLKRWAETFSCNMHTTDISDFVDLLEWDSRFSSICLSQVWHEFSKRPSLSSGLTEPESFLCELKKDLFNLPSTTSIARFLLLCDSRCEATAPQIQPNTETRLLDLCAQWLLTALIIWSATASSSLKGLMPKHLRMTALDKTHVQAPTPMNYWTHPASQPAFRFPSKHLSHLWLDPCCLDTVHAVVIGPYPNQ